MKPLKREDFDKAVAAMFRKADSNRDGTLTLIELRTEIEARREAVIAARFRRIDTDGNGSIDANEFSVWQRQMGSAALSESQVSRSDETLVPAVIEPDLGDKEQDDLLRQLIEPLNATTLVNANTNYDAGVTLAELVAYEEARFTKADTDGDGEISPDEVRSLQPRGGPRPGGMPEGRPPRLPG